MAGVQYRTGQDRTVQYSTVQYSTVQYSTDLDNRVYSIYTYCCIVYYSPIQNSTVQYKSAVRREGRTPLPTVKLTRVSSERLKILSQCIRLCAQL